MAYGLLKLGRVSPGKGPSNSQGVPPGIWCLHTLSTVPYVLLQGGDSARIITWGEAVEITSPVAVQNASYHAGEIVLAPAVAGVVSQRPASIIVPLDLSPIAGVPGESYSSRVDVRQAIRGFVVRPVADFQVGDGFTVEQFADRATAGTPGGTEAGPIVYGIGPLATATRQVNLAPGALQPPVVDVRAGAFWDWLRLRADDSVWGAAQTHVLLSYL